MRKIVTIYTNLLNKIIPYATGLANFLVWYFIIGMIYIHLRGNFLPNEQLVWDDIYYIWNNGLFLIFFILVRCFVDYKYRSSFNPVIFYSLIRLIWEIASPVTNIWEINHPVMVTIMFSILLTGGIVLLWKDLKNRARQEL